MIPFRIRAGLVLLALVGCKDKTEMAKVSEVFPNLPLPPNPSVVSRDGSPEALKLTLRSAAKPADVEKYYREILSRGGWRLVGDSRDRDGALVLMAEQDGPPLWVRIESADDSTATMVELAGALTRGAKPAKPAS